MKDQKLCHQLEQAMIKFLKSNAVINNYLLKTSTRTAYQPLVVPAAP